MLFWANIGQNDFSTKYMLNIFEVKICGGNCKSYNFLNVSTN